MEEPQILPQVTEPISRPSSTSTSASANLQQLPAITALAASNVAQISPQLRATAAPQNPTYTGATPPAATNGNGNLPTCQNCTTSTTPLWRRDEFGSVLCNACGLFLKLHGRPRPISLKTDVIKSRNRVKTIRPDLAAKKKQQQQAAQNFGLGADVNGADLSAHNAVAAAQAIRRTSHKANGNDGSDSPISRTGTPSMYNQGLPSFMVDDPYQGTGFNGASENGDRDAPQTHEQLIAQNSSLKTRVSELEVINELFRGRLSQLEQQEAAARRGQEVAGVEQTQLRTQLDASQESASQLQTQLDDSHRRENNLKRRLDELELELKAVKDALGGDLERPSKRSRTDEDAHLADQALAPAEEQSESQQELAAEQTEEPSTVDATMSEAPVAETPAAEETTNGTTEAAPEETEEPTEPLVEDAVADSSES
ncbi:zinc finger protein [Pochonia chlamydosporia 170]|uniref:Zinc finger protein n=1 Tax=Pochonia chlamydosporia 170 TaxID=1380566 RepID=A0A179FVL6_METCM|nr:zinc finger protein [Pochonia chlamydosporia 170]OAQ69039.1 zinc finger protein [Pochonia chlamydosporia 170]